MIRTLYFGPSHPGATGKHRADALTRIGCEVVLHDPFAGLATSLRASWKSKFHYHTGYRFLQSAAHKWLANVLQQSRSFDIIWVDGGELFGKDAVALLKTRGVPVVLFNHDDPTGVRDRRRFASLRKALPSYDAVTAFRDRSAHELAQVCNGHVVKLMMAYDEVRHSSAGISCEKVLQYESDVCFIGTWMRNEARDDFLLQLVDRGVNVSVWGDRWQKSPHWARIQSHWRGPGLAGQDYVAAIRGAKVCLGLLSKGNRDLHTTRSMEIPYAGGLLCAERTSEHLELYIEDEEAVFWSSAEECADKCLALLKDDDRRERIRLAGMRRVRENKVGNEDICSQILQAATK
jgi:hypothetical protein